MLNVVAFRKTLHLGGQVEFDAPAAGAVGLNDVADFHGRRL
jgi:hypothetical protein